MVLIFDIFLILCSNIINKETINFVCHSFVDYQAHCITTNNI